MERQLTSFQTECEKRFAAALARLGQCVENRRLEGVSEAYITGGTKGWDITFWIYTEGADFQTEKASPDQDVIRSIGFKLD